MAASKRTKPPFRADHVGSLLRPAELSAARERWRKGELSTEGLRTVEDRAVREAVAMQESVGLQSVTVDGGAGNDTVDAASQFNRLVSLNLIGGDGNDFVRGGVGNDRIDGGNGNDILYGLGGADLVIGGAGNDRLDGGNDGLIDSLFGGTGSDLFILYANRVDSVGDFFTSQDGFSLFA